jgi:DNA-directed RNA polymerase specialized sigma24 family protein
MGLTPDLLARARAFKRDAVVELLGIYYPQVCRIAYGLCGRPIWGRDVVRFVMSRSLRVMHTWTQEGAPERWFHHHTVLASRRVGTRPPAEEDVLLSRVDRSSPAYAGYAIFVRALRDLGTQQREAFLLHHGEQLHIRQIAVAMDCSTEAAANHLTAGTEALRAVAKEYFTVCNEAVAHAYRMQTPSDVMVVPAVEKHIKTHLWPRRIKRGIGWLVVLSLWAMLGLAVWYLWSRVEI